MVATILTADGAKELEQQLEYLKTVRRKEVAEQIKIAREFGDISENAEYDEAKNEQSRIEGEIVELEQKLRNATVIDVDAVETDRVGLGSRVSIKDISHGDTMEYLIVGSTEANPMQGRISNESPVGSALLGHNPGEIVDIHTPGGVIKMEILSIGKG